MCGKIVIRSDGVSGGCSGKRARGMKNRTDISADYMSGQIDRADMERGNGRPEVRKSLFRRLYRIIYGRRRGESNDIMTVFYTIYIGVYSYIYIAWRVDVRTRQFIYVLFTAPYTIPRPCR